MIMRFVLSVMVLLLCCSCQSHPDWRGKEHMRVLQLSDFENKTPKEIQKKLGTPQLVRQEGQFGIWVYHKDGRCILIYFDQTEKSRYGEARMTV